MTPRETVRLYNNFVETYGNMPIGYNYEEQFSAFLQFIDYFGITTDEKSVREIAKEIQILFRSTFQSA